MPDRESESPSFTHLRPLWRALGVQQTQWGKRYWLEINGRAQRFKAAGMYGLSFLLDIYPDREHWRRQFPYGVGRRVDTGAAMTYFVRACERVGEYVPGSDGRTADGRVSDDQR